MPAVWPWGCQPTWASRLPACLPARPQGMVRNGAIQMDGLKGAVQEMRERYRRLEADVCVLLQGHRATGRQLEQVARCQQQLQYSCRI